VRECTQLIYPTVAAIPITMLWKVRISTRRKLGLGLFLSVTVLTMIFAIARVSTISSSWYRQDMTWLYLWSNLECNAGNFPQKPLMLRLLTGMQRLSSPLLGLSAPYSHLGIPSRGLQNQSMHLILLEAQLRELNSIPLHRLWVLPRAKHPTHPMGPMNSLFLEIFSRNLRLDQVYRRSDRVTRAWR
jgi:hypothetical protein